MDVIAVTRLIALLIFAISCVTIYHNTNSYEPKYRIIYIIIRYNFNVWYYINNLYYECKRNKQ